MLQVNVVALLGIIGVGFHFGTQFFINCKHYEGTSLYQTCRKTNSDVCLPVDIFIKSTSEWDDRKTDQYFQIGTCIQDNEYLRPNRAHIFNYEISAKGLASGTTVQHRGIHINCEGVINGKGNCNYILHIEKCSLAEQSTTSSKQYSPWIKQHNKSDDFTIAIRRYPVEFTMVNGAVGGLWAHMNESLIMLNFKRGIITTLLSRRKLSSSDFKNQEMRTDVQGICTVKYEQSGSTVNLVKYMNKCQFPSRVDWPYSPWSLFWNMSFVQMFWINSTVNCMYKFSYGGNLDETLCDERHAIMLESTKDTEISVHTIISQQLKIQKMTTIQALKFDKQECDLKNIQYEYEILKHPRHNPEALTRKVISLLEILTPNEEEPIEIENANLLDELIHLLRQSSDLSEIAEYFHKCKLDSTPTCIDKNQIYNQNEIKLAQLWRDALIQCNRASCIRAFRMLLQSNAKNIEEVISAEYIDFIFFSWINVQIDELKVVEDLLSIVKSSKPTRLQILALSSITNNFWKRHKHQFEKKVPTSLKNIVEFITKPLNTDCTISKIYQVEDITIALQAMSNMGNLIERVKPEYISQLLPCIINKDVHWSFSVLAIQATRRMNSSDSLYNFLLNILKNHELKHEDHVWAYVMLANKFGNSELLHEVTMLLNGTENFGLNFNLKTFILTHMRTVAKTTDPEQARFAKQVQEAMPNIQMFNDVTETNPVTQHINASTKMPDQINPSSYYIPENAELRSSQGYFSKYEEAEYSYGSSILRDSINRFGFGYSNSLLYTGNSYVPYASWTEGILYLFGKKISVDSIFTNTRCFAEIIQASGLEYDKKRMAIILKGIGENQCTNPIVDRNTNMTWNKFPYEVNEQILENLISLQNQELKTRNSMQKKDNIDGLLSIGFLDDILATITFDELLKGKKRFATNDISNSDSFNSNYWKVVEAFNLVPTLIGLPLNWTADAFFIHNSMQYRSGNGNFTQMDLKTINNLNALATLKNGMILDLPGFSNIGVQSFSTISTSIGANVDIKWDNKAKTINLNIDLPQRPMQLLSLTRRNSLVKNSQPEDITDWNVDRITENWCTDKLEEFLGIKFCHSKSYPNVTHRADKPWTLMAANAHWNYTMEPVTKVNLQIAFHKVEDEKSQTFKVYVNSQNFKNQNKPTELIKLLHKQNLATGEFQTKLNTFFAQIKASKENIHDNSYHLKAEYKFLYGQVTMMDFQTKTTLQKLSEEAVKSHLSKSSASNWLSVPVREVNLNITSSENFYGFNYKHQQFPTSFYTKHIFQYKSLNKEPWLWKLIENDIFREDSDSGWVELYQEVHSSVISTTSIPGSQLSYNYLKTPKSIIQLHKFQGPTKATVDTIHLNLTKHNLPDYNLMTYVNFTVTTAFKDEKELQTRVHKIKIEDPWYSITAELASRYAHGPPDNLQIKFAITRESLSNTKLLQHRTRDGDPHMSWIHQLASSGNFYPSTSSVVVEIDVTDNEFPHWKSQMAFKHPYSNILLAAKKNVSARFIYHKTLNETPIFEIYFQSKNLYLLPYDARHDRSFLLEIPSNDFCWKSKLSLDFSLDNEIVLWHSNWSHISTEQSGNYSFNISFSKPDGKVYLSEDFRSQIFNRSIRLITSYPTIFTAKFDLDMNITTYSSIESLFNVNLRQMVGEGKEVMNMTHKLVDIDVNGDWQDGYKKTFNFKSKNKDLVPNMVWTIDYPDANKGITLQLKFPDIETEFYINCQKNTKSTKLLFTVCMNRNCIMGDNETEQFVAEIELRLANAQKLTETVIYNPILTKLLKTLIAERAEQVELAFTRLISNPDYSSSARSILNAKEYTISAAVTIMNEMKHFFNYVGYVVTKDAIITAPISMALNTVNHFVGPVIKDTYCDWFWTYFEIKYKIVPWTGQIARRILSEYMYRPGIVYGRSYISSISLPVYLTSFMKLPTQLSPSFIRQLLKLRNSITRHSSTSILDFSGENYDRHAILSKNGILRTFDGMILKDPSWMANDHCAYLLAQDFTEHQFTVYHKSGIQLLFPEIQLGLNYDGQVTLNERATDLPFQISNGSIQVVRKSDFIQIKTTYNFMLILSLKNKYFLFYTNKHKHSRLNGMLGNNNDNPADDIKDPLHWELTNNSGCKSIYKHNSHHKCNVEYLPAIEWQTLMWRPDSPTLPCHDIVSLTGIAHQYISCAKIPNDFVDAYLALCSAKGVPVGSLSTFIGECDRKTSWSTKIEGELEVIFLIDQTTCSPENILKGIETLAFTVQKQFLEEGYERIEFGLVGFKGQGYRYEPLQHTMNGQLLASAKLFTANGLNTLKFNGPTDNNGSAALAALGYAAEHYALSQKAVHMFIVVTAQDVDAIASLSLFHDALQKVLLQSVTVYTIADYPDATRSNGIYGIRGDGYIFPQPKTKMELFVDFPKGQLAMFTSTTRGAVWQLSYMEDINIPLKHYVQAFAWEMVARAKQDNRLCRQCHCHVNNAGKLLNFCDFMACENQGEKGK